MRGGCTPVHTKFSRRKISGLEKASVVYVGSTKRVTWKSSCARNARALIPEIREDEVTELACCYVSLISIRGEMSLSCELCWREIWKSWANFLAAGLKLMSISMSEAGISPLHISFPPFWFCFGYVDGSPLIDTNDPDEADKERVAPSLIPPIQACQPGRPHLKFSQIMCRNIDAGFICQIFYFHQNLYIQQPRPV